MRRGRVFDAFLFNDELDILELRLNVLADVVDRFVLVESTVTFGGAEKPLHFAASRDRFERWLDRITHVVVSDTPDTGGNRWGRERYQRDRILRGLGECRCDDIVVVSDADEIPDPDAVAQRRLGGYHQEYMQYYLNCRHMSEYWVGSVALYHFELAAEGPQRARDRRFELPRVERGGWHFAYAMTPDAFRAKLGAFSHAEYDTPEHAAAFEQRRAGLTDVFAAKPGTLTVLDLDTAYLPEHLKTNRTKYAHLLREGPLPAATAAAVAAAPPPPDTERGRGSPQTVVIYAYHETPRAAENLELFAAIGMAPAEGVRYVVVVNGQRCSVTLREREDCTVLRRENLGFDFGAHAHALAHLAARHGVGAGELPFDHFVFLNSSVAGPFLPSYWPPERHWTKAFTARLNDRVKLVGPSIVCLPHADAGGWGPRVEGYCFATDRDGLAAALRQGRVFVDHATKFAAIVDGEYGLSRAILAAGHSLDCLLYRYQGIDWRDPANWTANDNRHPSRAGTYDGISIHPFEVVFHKRYWSDQPDRPVAGDYVERYMRWKVEELRRSRGDGAAPGISAPARGFEDEGPAQQRREAAMGEPGRFIWHQLATTDLERAKAFYAALLGWRYEAVAGGETGVYTVIHAGEPGIGGMVPAGAGAPSQWTPYVTVDEVDAAVKRGARAKGKVVVPPSPIPSYGRFALIADPSGAAIMPFVPEGPDQPDREGPPPRGTVCWNELYTHDAAAALKFYQAVFGWGHGTMDMGPGGTYHLFKRAGKDVAGMMEMSAEHMPRSQWMPYFVVDDVDESFAAALASGAAQRMAPHTAAGVGRFAIITDPTGATFGLFRA